MAWKTYSLDQRAQKLVLEAKLRDPDSLNQSYKMRMAVTYGLERFWGEHLRLEKKEPKKSQYWKETWDTLVEVMAEAGIKIPNDPVKVDDTKAVKVMSERLWDEKSWNDEKSGDDKKSRNKNESGNENKNNEDENEKKRIAIAVLTQLCDCIVWWTQRYKGKVNLDN